MSCCFFFACVCTKFLSITSLELKTPTGGGTLDKSTDTGASNGASSGSSSHAGAIAGGVVGGIVGLVIIAFGIFFWRRRPRKTSIGIKPFATEGRSQNLVVEPFRLPVNNSYDPLPTSTPKTQDSHPGVLRSEVLELRREIDHMRATTGFVPPPQYELEPYGSSRPVSGSSGFNTQPVTPISSGAGTRNPEKHKSFSDY